MSAAPDEIADLRRRLALRAAELACANRRIEELTPRAAALREGKTQLRENRRKLDTMRRERDALHGSLEYKVGRALIRPFLKLAWALKGGKRLSAESTKSTSKPSRYQQWLIANRVKPAELEEMKAAATEMSTHISIVMPVYKTPREVLEEAVASVRSQAYPHWELILVDDGSDDQHLAARLREFEKADSRIRVHFLSVNRGIALASNAALELATGEFVGLLDHDDALEPDALFRMAWAIHENPEADLLYSDEDKIDARGSYDAPFFKPDWSPDALLSTNYLCHFTLMRRSIATRLGGFRTGFDGAQDFDFFLRASELARRVAHIPRILYHWRMSGNSTAEDVMNKPAAIECGRRAVEQAMGRRGIAGAALSMHGRAQYRVVRAIAEYKKIAIVTPGSSLVGIAAMTDYPNYEIVDSAQKTDAPWLLFLDGEAEVLNADWLTSMVEHIQRPEIGAVGARLLYPDKSVRHAGIILAPQNAAADAWKNMGQAPIIRNCSAVSGACLLTRRDLFERMGGFDPALPTRADVDYCLKLRKAGLWIIYTPFAEIIHHGPVPNPVAAEEATLRGRWPGVFASDPFGNPNLGFYSAAV